MPKNDHSLYIKAYAAERGVPLRTAQDRFKKRHADVMDWLVRAGIKLHQKGEHASPVEAMALVDRLRPEGSSPFADGMKCDQSPEPPALKKQPSERTLEEHAEVEAWLLFIGASNAARAAAKDNDISAAGFARCAVECLKAFQSARASRIRAEIDAKRLLPIAEYDALCNDARRVTEIWKSMIPDLATMIDPTNPARLMRLFEHWVQDRINPAIAAFMGDDPAQLPAAA